MNQPFLRRLWAATLAAATLVVPAAASTPAADDPDSPAALLGTTAPDWAFTRWVRGGPLTLDRLRGKVVLVRWWTEDCHFCQATLPEIEALRKRYGPDGFVTVAVFHPKPPHEVTDRHVLTVAGKLGYEGPVALDRDWVTLERYWLDGHPERNWTSVSFLIDRAGVIRWAHGGGEYHLSSDPRHRVCDADARELESTIVELLAKKTAAVSN